MNNTGILDYRTHETPAADIRRNMYASEKGTGRMRFPRMAVPVNRKIMVVDDEPDVVKALAIRLNSWGFDVIWASDGVSATIMAVNEMPDAILLDIGIPDGDGHTVAERLRTSERTRTTPVIYLTARTASEDIRTAKMSGAFDYITKPFFAADLLTALNRALNIA
jgi:DNA-binding response OmpR family regulator